MTNQGWGAREVSSVVKHRDELIIQHVGLDTAVTLKNTVLHEGGNSNVVTSFYS